ncbi:MAG: hypothetical protein GC208_00845 [Alphaproteobacteria bacterium]|nr:hypothetical protein [Alphaproteobacteria bacterium]
MIRLALLISGFVVAAIVIVVLLTQVMPVGGRDHAIDEAGETAIVEPSTAENAEPPSSTRGTRLNQETREAPSEVKVASTIDWTVIVLGIAGAATLLALFATIYVFRWRLIRIGEAAVLAPDSWASAIEAQGGAIEALETRVAKLDDLQRQVAQFVAEKVNEIEESSARLVTRIEDRDRELQRYKDGYDAQILKRHVRGLVDLADMIEDQLLSNDAVDPTIRNIHDAIWESLFSCGVEEYSPAAGVHRKTVAEFIADRPEQRETDDEMLDFHIAEILRPARVFRGDIAKRSGDRIIKKAAIAIYRYRSS